jgi:diguanylate cyclase (GGDEF)-like protein
MQDQPGDRVNAFPGRRRSDATEVREPIRALVVEDDPNYIAYIAALMRRCGFVVDEAANGRVALEALRRAAYDIVIVDQEMPHVTGIELVAVLREDETLKGVYALMLTGREDMETKLAALTAGFDDFLTKTSPDLEIVAKLVAARRIVVRQRALDVAVRELYGLATRDELTGVFNRRLFLSETERLLAESVPLSVILFDLDDFKWVNDTYGHLTGDRVLRDIGALFQRSTRPEDLIARYGGDEFVMVVAALPLPEVEGVAQRLSAEVRALQWMVDEAMFGVGVTCGVASSLLLEKPTVNQLLNVADRDLYKNKYLRTHRGDRPEWYEYPADEPGVEAVLTEEAAAKRRAPAPASPARPSTAGSSSRRSTP